MTSGRRWPPWIAVFLLPIVAGACAPRVVVSLPGGVGTPDPTVLSRFTTATDHCAGVRTWSAEVGVSGSVRGRTIRLKVLAGTTEDGDARLEGVAPFGAPVFVFAAIKGRASLLLPREARVLRDVPAEDVLDALVGLPLPAIDLHRLLSGCTAAGAAPDAGRVLGKGWLSVAIGPGRTAYLREHEGVTRVEAARLANLTVGYSAFDDRAPREVRLVTTGGGSGGAHLLLKLSQVEENITLPHEAFRFDVPAGARPISLAELREWGLGAGAS